MAIAPQMQTPAPRGSRNPPNETPPARCSGATANVVLRASRPHAPPATAPQAILTALPGRGRLQGSPRPGPVDRPRDNHHLTIPTGGRATVRTWTTRLTSALGTAALLSSAALAQTSKPTVKITTPRNGASVTGPVKVTLKATGVEIVPATDERPGTGHHHLFVDRDVTPANDTIPRGVTGIIHLGRGQTDFVLDSLRPGPHRVIAVVADWKHVPLKPLVVDTVRFTVK